MDSRDCRQPPGLLRPVIDRNRCEGKGDCVEVCPYGVFSVGTLPIDRRKELNLFGKLRGYAHGWQQAFTPNADVCRACGHCVKACPERAITLVRHGHNGRHDASIAAD
ncbi:4Fe-4S binding protein [Mitsuaria sp. CC2]|jgi:NAD-dependent dihydropyrimidine dehydrogenase PreA subunit|uniref:4Fe-4S binding protein n=1 Tax=Mitsuaria sp. CC2 TaxID=3029186 RepID=UPI003B8C2726